MDNYLSLLDAKFSSLNELNESLKGIQENIPKDFRYVRNQAVRQFLKKINSEGEKMKRHIDSSEFIAWGARNIFEIELTLKFILSKEQNFHEWFTYRIKDEREIISNLNEFFKDENSMNLIDEFDQRLKKLDELEKKLEIAQTEELGYEFILSVKKQKNIRQIAVEVNAENRYKAFYKFYSKFVHPSAYMIWNTSLKINSKDYRASFLIISIESLTEINTCIATYFKRLGQL